jgi:hypothetical protein
MLQKENIQPAKLAYDRPSPKLLSFLSKHYSLSDFIPQANNYVIYKKYFSTKANSSPPISPSNKTNMSSNGLSPLTHEEFGVNSNQKISPPITRVSPTAATASAVTPNNRTFVQYNPISHHFQQVEVTDPFLRRTGRKRGLDYSPEVRNVSQFSDMTSPTNTLTAKNLSFTSPVTAGTRSQRPF